MKVRLKTAHGKYVSAQPDGRFEVRDHAGPWEEFDLERLVLEVPDHPPKSPPVEHGPSPSPSSAYVAAVKQQLQEQGVNLTGPCGAFAITKRVAWGLRHLGAGLLSKPHGNNCEGFATDIVLFRDGHAVDILGDGGNSNTPLWSLTDVEDPSGRFREAVQP